MEVVPQLWESWWAALVVPVEFDAKALADFSGSTVWPKMKCVAGRKRSIVHASLHADRTFWPVWYISLFKYFDMLGPVVCPGPLAVQWLD